MAAAFSSARHGRPTASRTREPRAEGTTFKRRRVAAKVSKPFSANASDGMPTVSAATADAPNKTPSAAWARMCGCDGLEVSLGRAHDRNGSDLQASATQVDEKRVQAVCGRSPRSTAPRLGRPRWPDPTKAHDLVVGLEDCWPVERAEGDLCPSDGTRRLSVPATTTIIAARSWPGARRTQVGVSRIHGRLI